MARLIAQKLGETMKATFLVDNKAGAGGNIAHQQVANGPADGSMLLLGSIAGTALVLMGFLPLVEALRSPVVGFVTLGLLPTVDRMAPLAS